MSIDEIRKQKTAWLICFVRANRPISRLFCNVELAELVQFASDEIKRRNRRAFENRYADGDMGHY